MSTVYKYNLVKSIDEVKNVQHLIEFAVNTAIKRFKGSSLHVESIMNELNPLIEVKKLKTLIKTDIDVLNKKLKEKELNKDGSVRKKKQSNLALKNLYPSTRERILRDIKDLTPYRQDEEIKRLYAYKDPSSLNELEHRVLSIVCDVHKIGIITVLSKYRGIEAVNARMQFMVLMFNLFGYGSVKVGKLLSRDHSTIIHAKKAHNDILDLNNDKLYISKFNEILLKIKEEFPELFGISEDKIDEIRREYKKVVRTRGRRSNKIIENLTIGDLIQKTLKKETNESN